MLVRAGLGAAAETRLTEEVAAGIGTREQLLLERIVAEAKGADPIMARKHAYEQFGQFRDLTNLVNLLKEHGVWIELCHFSEKLFSITHSLEEAIRFCRSLDRTKQYARLLSFLSGNQTLVAQSSYLETLLTWSLYRDGQFNAAAGALDRLAKTRDDPNDRALRVRIAIASGKWYELASLTTEVWQHRDNRTAGELLAAGDLARAVAAPHARALIFAAAEKAPDDPNILTSAYLIATNAGWEQNEITAKWLATAAQLSDPSGPLKATSLRELVDQMPQWERRDSAVWEQLSGGSIPVFSAANALNRTLTDVALLPSLANPNETDVRRRRIVYAFSGARSSVTLAPKKIAVDLTALFTFARLDLLETIQSAYEIVIPHSKLIWLLQERRRATFHQPSQIRDARELQRLVGANKLQVLQKQWPADHRLVKEIGADLAGLLLTADERASATDHVPRYVICSSPVHRVESLLEEEADLTSYAPYLCSCHAVVEKLRARGVLTQLEKRRAFAYLKLHERPWPSEPQIADAAELFLDNVAVSYLRTIGLLEKIKVAGLTAYITESEDKESCRLIDIENLTTQQVELIDAIRSSLERGLTVGRVCAAPAMPTDDDAQPLNGHPTIALLSSPTDVSGLVIDDRSINRYLNHTAGGRDIPILSSLDIIDDLGARKRIAPEELFSHRTFLRQAGYQFVSVTVDELMHHLDNAPVSDGVVVETAELRAVRESLLKARMSSLLQNPLELPWLHQTMGRFITCIKRLWQEKSEPTSANAYSEWLVNLLDLRGWATTALPENARSFAIHADAAHRHTLMLAPDDVSDEVKNAYFSWVDSRLTKDLRDTQSEAFRWIVEQSRAMICQAVENIKDTHRQNDTKREYICSSLTIALLQQFSPILRAAIIDDDDFRRRRHTTTQVTIAFEAHGSGFRRSLLFDAIRSAFDTNKEKSEVTDTDGRGWEIQIRCHEGRTIVALTQEEKRLEMPFLALLSSDNSTRVNSFRKLASDMNLSDASRHAWAKSLRGRRPDDNEMALIQADFNDTPIIVSERMREHLSGTELSLEGLIPRSERYFERLIGHCDDNANIAEYISDVAVPHFRSNVAWDPLRGYQLSLLLTSHPAISTALGEVDVPDGLLAQIFEWAAENGDAMSQASCIEIGLRRLASEGHLIEPLGKVINSLIKAASAENGHPFELLSALFIAVYGEISYRQLFAAKPPFWRRLAALAHAGVIARQLIPGTYEMHEVADWLQSIRVHVFALQCFVDMRREPRWFADLATPVQFKNELLGRVWMTAKGSEAVIIKQGLTDKLLGDGEGSLLSHIQFPHVFISGPLEGGSSSIQEIPTEMLESIQSSLTGATITLTTLMALANAVPIFRVPMELANLAADAIKRADYRLESGDENLLAAYVLFALALVAATVRNHALADVIFVVLRKYRALYPDELSIVDTFRIGMVASASRENLVDWTKCVGSCMNDLAVQSIAADEAKILHANVVQLCQLVPELWSTCGQAEAALLSVIGR